LATWLLIGTGLGIAFTLAALWLIRLLAADESAPAAIDAPAAAPEPPPAAPPPALPAPPRSLQDIARELDAFYEASGHPQELAGNATFREGVAALADPAVPLDQVANYAVGSNKELAAMAAEALAQRADSAPAIPRALRHLRFAYVWTTYYLLRFFDARTDAPIAARVLLATPEWWVDNAVMPGILSDFVDARVAGGETLDLERALAAEPREDLATFEAMLDKLTTPHASTLRAELRAWRETRVDRKFLASIGKLREPSPDDPVIVEHAELRTGVQVAADAILATPPRSFVVVGESGVGKSALVQALVRRLHEAGWTVFEASAVDINAGMSYIGELEQRMKRLVAELDVRRRVVWYVPNLHELFYAGRHKFSPSGILDHVMPAIEAGRVCVVGEVQPAALEKVLQQRPRMRGAFASLALESMPAAAALALGERLAALEFEPAGITVAPGTIEEALDLARHYLGTRALPGSLVDLLRQTKARLAATGQHAMGREALLLTLTELTGLPAEVLDDRAGLDPAALGKHFAARVMGQPEAVSCLVDRIAMLKAGLTDPRGPRAPARPRSRSASPSSCSARPNA
jgi:ATP-dependent Clp protease ATP-binding subunit ClpC